MAIAFLRLKAALGPYLDIGAPQFTKTDQVIKKILETPELRAAFEYEREGKRYVLPSNAILRWLKTARYWGLIDQDLLSLTLAGKRFKSGDFSNRLQRHLAIEVFNQWGIELSDIEALLQQLNGSSSDTRPDTDNWYHLVARTARGEISKTRFRQLVSFLLGCGVLRRDICHLFFRV